MKPNVAAVNESISKLLTSSKINKENKIKSSKESNR